MQNQAGILKHGDQARIAADVGLSRSFVCEVFCGRKKCPPVLAKYMEDHFGIDRRSWDFPSEYANPILQKQAKPPANAA